MKATAAISIAALLAALVATPTMALDLNAGVGVNAGANVSSDDNNTNADVDLGLDANASADDNNLSAGATVKGDASADTDDDLDVSADGSAKGGVSVETDDGDVSVDTKATGAINASAGDDDVDLDTRLDLVVKLITDADYDEGSFSAWVDGSNTTVVKTDDLFDAKGKAKIDAALEANADEQGDLKAAINANAKLKAWLDSNGIDAASVIAIDVSADGSVDVYEG